MEAENNSPKNKLSSIPFKLYQEQLALIQEKISENLSFIEQGEISGFEEKEIALLLTIEQLLKEILWLGGRD